MDASYCLDGWSPPPPAPIPPQGEQRAFGAALREAVLRRWPDYPWDEAVDVLAIAAMYARPYLEALMDGPWPATGMDGAVRRDLEKVLRCRLPAVTGAADQEAAARSRAAKGLFVRKAEPPSPPPGMAQTALPLAELEEIRQPEKPPTIRVGEAAPKRRRGKAKRRRKTSKAKAAPKTAKAKAAKAKAAKATAPKTAAPKRKTVRTAKPKPTVDVAPPQAMAAIVRGLTAADLAPDHAARLAGLDPKALARMLAGKAKMPKATADRLQGLIRAARALREEAR